MAKGNRNKPKFEDAVSELEAIIERIESGETGLEESLKAYEKGMKLVGQCRTILETVEKRIAELSVDSNGSMKIKGAAGSGSPDTGPDPTADDDVPF